MEFTKKKKSDSNLYKIKKKRKGQLADTSLTSVGDVTLISGAAAASNKLIMFSVFISLDGVTLGGGGTAGFNWDRKTQRWIWISEKIKYSTRGVTQGADIPPGGSLLQNIWF